MGFLVRGSLFFLVRWQYLLVFSIFSRGSVKVRNSAVIVRLLCGASKRYKRRICHKKRHWNKLSAIFVCSCVFFVVLRWHLPLKVGPSSKLLSHHAAHTPVRSKLITKSVTPLHIPLIHLLVSKLSVGAQVCYEIDTIYLFANNFSLYLRMCIFCCTFALKLSTINCQLSTINCQLLCLFPTVLQHLKNQRLCK